VKCKVDTMYEVYLELDFGAVVFLGSKLRAPQRIPSLHLQRFVEQKREMRMRLFLR